MKRKPALPEMTIEERYANTHPIFQAKIERISLIARIDKLEAFSLWREYSKACQGSDQSAILCEFVQWYSKQLGGNVAQLTEAIQ